MIIYGFSIGRASTKDAATQTETTVTETSVSSDSSPGPVSRPSQVYTRISQTTRPDDTEQQPHHSEYIEPQRTYQETSSSSSSDLV